MSIPSWVAEVLYSGDLPSREWQSRPQALDVDDEPWTMAADGVVAVFERGTLWGAQPIDPKVEATALSILAAPHVHSLTSALTHFMSLANLLAFAGQPRPDVPCSECNGSGTRAHNCDCVLCQEDTEACNCDGGATPPTPEYFSAGDYCFDLVPLARALAGLTSTDGEVRAGIISLAAAPLHTRGAVCLAFDLPTGRRVRLMMCVKDATTSNGPVLPWKVL